jgi:arylsulfatase A-like enzyme
VLLVSVAGLTPDLYGREGPRPPAMPTLVALALAGVSAQVVVSVAPAAAYPVHATLLSGQPPALHGIVADRRLGSRGVRETLYWHASHLRAPTLWQLARQKQLRVAALGWPSTVGAAIDRLIPDIVPTRRGETWMGVLADAATPSLLELAKGEGGSAAKADRRGPARDAVLTGISCQTLGSSTPPELLLLHLSQAESPLRDSGPGSPEALAAFALVDRELGRLLDCLRDSARIGATALLVVGDRGLVHVHTALSPNTVLAREGLLELSAGADDGIARWSAISRSNGGSAFVYARSEDDAVRARRALAAEARRTRAFRVVSAEEMLRLGADPDAWFGLEAEPGFVFVDSSDAPPLRPAARRGAGGYLPHRPEMNAGFVAWGRGIRSGVRVPIMRQTDVAPTVARLLGLDLGDVDGRVLVGALKSAATVPAPASDGAIAAP